MACGKELFKLYLMCQQEINAWEARVLETYNLKIFEVNKKYLEIGEFLKKWPAAAASARRGRSRSEPSSVGGGSRIKVQGYCSV